MTITTNDIQLYKILRERLGEGEAEALVTFVDSKIKDANEQNVRMLATKEDLANTKTDMIKWFFAFFMALALMIIGLYFKK
jgi:predicted nucleic acid-binding protein